jgi:hypothetical protein
MRLSVTVCARPVSVSTTQTSGGAARAREDQRNVRAVRRDGDRRLRAGQMWTRTVRELGSRQVVTRFQVAQAEPVVTVRVDEPGEDPPVGGRPQVLANVLRRLFHPLVAVRGQVVEREAAELATFVGRHVEARTVAGPRAREVQTFVVVRSQLARLVRLEVDQMDRGVAVVAEVDREQLRAVR